jgi:hypothetical protein
MQKISGILIFLSFITTLYSYFFQNDFLIISGILAWSAFVILFSSLKSKKLLIILFLLSIIALIYSYMNNYEINFIKLFTVNQYLLTLLIGVGFLRLIATPKNENLKDLPKGKGSFIRTYMGVHFFGSVINMSSLLLVADKMYKKAKLSDAQIVLLTRAFSSDAYWSPFFVAFAAAITYAPNLDTHIIIINGLFLVLIGFMFTFYEITKNDRFELENFRGYPIALETLVLPFSLAFLVLLTNYFVKDLKVIVLIALFSLILAFIVLPIKKGINKSINIFKSHILEELPKMKVEMSLFLIAGMFGISISSILFGIGIELPFEKFDWIIASIFLALFIILGFVGIHPIISIAIVGEFLSGVNHTLLAVAFLMSWATTVSTSPFSGLNLTIVSRYTLDSKRVFKLNIIYAIKMYFVSVFCLYCLSKYLGI